jgi:hypothetical protein
LNHALVYVDATFYFSFILQVTGMPPAYTVITIEFDLNAFPGIRFRIGPALYQIRL